MTMYDGAAKQSRIAEMTNALKLEKHPEGGWFAEVYTAPVSFAEAGKAQGSRPSHQALPGSPRPADPQAWRRRNAFRRRR